MTDARHPAPMCWAPFLLRSPHSSGPLSRNPFATARDLPRCSAAKRRRCWRERWRSGALQISSAGLRMRSARKTSVLGSASRNGPNAIRSPLLPRTAADRLTCRGRLCHSGPPGLALRAATSASTSPSAISSRRDSRRAQQPSAVPGRKWWLQLFVIQPETLSD